MAKAVRASPKPLVDLSISNPTQAGLALPGNLWDAREISVYQPSAQGSRTAREAVARYYEEEFAAGIGVDQVQLCASTSEAYSYCLKLLADAGDEVLIPQPSYPLLEHLLCAEGVVPVAYPVHGAAGEWVLDREYLRRVLTPRTRAIVIVHPNNPTGHFFPREDFAWLQEALPPEAAILSDEVFADYGWQEKGWSYAGAHRTFVLSGLSKICLLPQMKLGWIVMPKDPAIWRAMEFIADTYLSVSALVADMAPVWLERRQEFQAPLRERVNANLPLFPANPAAGWTAIVRGNGGMPEDERVMAMIDRGYWLQPGYYFDLPGQDNYVLSLLTEPGQLREGLRVLNSF